MNEEAVANQRVLCGCHPPGDSLASLTCIGESALRLADDADLRKSGIP